MTKAEILKQVLSEQKIKREQIETDCKVALQKYLNNLEFKNAYENYNKKLINYAKAKHQSIDVDIALQDLNIEKLAFENVLKKLNIDKNSLFPNYDCKICKDKGIVNGKYCSCVMNKVNIKLQNLSKSATSLQTFENSDERVLNADKNLQKTYDVILKWIDNFENTQIKNINFIGQAGTGKTFLLECIASKLLKMGVNVHFTTAFSLINECKNYHFSKPSLLEEYLNCKALIIDDLGCEPIIKNITIEYLYNIISLRQKNGLATLISTNLDREDLLDRYDMRIFSRLFLKKVSLTVLFSNKDLRTH